MSDPIQNAVQTGPPSRPPRTDRPRPYIPPQPAIPPDYDRFCEVHTRHRALWRLTYSPGHPAPYQAHHRLYESTALAASNLAALDFALTQFAPPPPRTRPYLDLPAEPDRRDRPASAPTTRSKTGTPTRRLDLREARGLHQMADDLIASLREDTYWPAAVREAALEILARAAALLGDHCGRGTPQAPNTTAPAPCLRPAAHEGCHLDASGRTWPSTEEGDR
ncbi:hypothetical protein [Streptomonospora wellingtoniae]|uniref:Uncharacterized protein n=1 Tax=Streptomonospora wellingtoniae TaxID=3075544 RepID=A0ABU2KYG2_9ACTN|nr:hypothetical protein [Streptomonospora sp. DSM 45055]MDT0304256.1 hypothetical protein [Streptomonospora sp. DSM 45055]